jgi:hypothetical protein
MSPSLAAFDYRTNHSFAIIGHHLLGHAAKSDSGCRVFRQQDYRLHQE